MAEAAAAAAAAAAAGSAAGVATDLERRTQTFVRRERDFKTKIELLEAELSRAKATAVPTVAESEAERHMGKLRDLHGAPACPLSRSPTTHAALTGCCRRFLAPACAQGPSS